MLVSLPLSPLLLLLLLLSEVIRAYARRIRTICLHFEHLTYSIRWMRNDRDTHRSTEYRITSKGETRTDVVNNAIRACLVQSINDSAGIVRGQLIAFEWLFRWVICSHTWKRLMRFLRWWQEEVEIEVEKGSSEGKKRCSSRKALFHLDLLVGIIIITRDIIEKSCIPFLLGSIGCRLMSFIQVRIFQSKDSVPSC